MQQLSVYPKQENGTNNQTALYPLLEEAYQTAIQKGKFGFRKCPPSDPIRWSQDGYNIETVIIEPKSRPPSPFIQSQIMQADCGEIDGNTLDRIIDLANKHPSFKRNRNNGGDGMIRYSWKPYKNGGSPNGNEFSYRYGLEINKDGKHKGLVFVVTHNIAYPCAYPLVRKHMVAVAALVSFMKGGNI